MPSSWDNVYVGYQVVKQGTGSKTFAFGQKGRSFRDAKKGVIATAEEFAAAKPGVPSRFFLRPGDVSAVATDENIDALFHAPAPNDEPVCDVVPDGTGRSVVQPVRKKSASRKPAKPKTFVGYSVVDDWIDYFPVSAPGYVEARDEVIKKAARFHVDDPKRKGSFHIRNQKVAAGKAAHDMANVPCKRSEVLVQLRPSKAKNGKAQPVFPGALNKVFKPNQDRRDEDVFVKEQLEALVQVLQAAAPTTKADGAKR